MYIHSCDLCIVHKIDVFVYIYIYVDLYIYIYRERERDRERYIYIYIYILVVHLCVCLFIHSLLYELRPQLPVLEALHQHRRRREDDLAIVKVQVNIMMIKRGGRRRMCTITVTK